VPADDRLPGADVAQLAQEARLSVTTMTASSVARHLDPAATETHMRAVIGGGVEVVGNAAILFRLA
jgi:hypothetical protein